MISLRLAAVGLAMALSAQANAAEISVLERGVIGVIGEIVKGDADKFAAIAMTAPAGSVVGLSSGGGSIIESLMIGEAIHARHFATGVPNDRTCASACGLIWLAGGPRYLGTTAKVGFHAAYTLKEGVASEVGSGNALVGAYLTKLGFSYEAVVYLTSAAPSDMTWLHPAEAERMGIEAVIIEKKQEATEETNVAQLPDGSPLERKIMGYVASYYNFWSKGGQDVEGLAQYYRDSVSFYGAMTPLPKIIEEKRKFSARWPVRKYTLKTGTFYVKCSETCSITGVVEWDVASIERNAHSTGAANFVIKFDSSTGRIIAEDGSVLDNHLGKLDTMPQASPPMASFPMPMASQPASPQAPTPSGNGWTPEQTAAAGSASFGAGMADRLEYERWFDGLAPGPYRSGSLFWAENRSLKLAPYCNQPNREPLWIMGCSADKARLDNSDYRRRTDRGYWLGWNSL